MTVIDLFDRTADDDDLDRAVIGFAARHGFEVVKTVTPANGRLKSYTLRPRKDF